MGMSANKEQPLVVNETTAAKFLGVTRATLQGWRHKGIGPKFLKYSGGCVRYKMNDLEQFMESSIRQSTSDQVGFEADRVAE